jgi:hypothetical protein
MLVYGRCFFLLYMLVYGRCLIFSKVFLFYKSLTSLFLRC